MFTIAARPYLDDDELSLAVVRRMRDYTVAMLDSSLSPAALDEDWFPLAGAFVAPYGWEGLRPERDCDVLRRDRRAHEVIVRSLAQERRSVGVTPEVKDVGSAHPRTLRGFLGPAKRPRLRAMAETLPP